MTRTPLGDGYEDSLIRREVCACGDVLIVPVNAKDEVIQRVVERHNQRLRHRIWRQYENPDEEP